MSLFLLLWSAHLVNKEISAVLVTTRRSAYQARRAALIIDLGRHQMSDTE